MIDKQKTARDFIQAIDAELERRGWGSIARMERALGVEDQGWWQNRRRSRDLYIGPMMQILDHLGLDPVLFMRKVVGYQGGVELDRPHGKPPEFVQLAWKRFREVDAEAGTLDPGSLRLLDRMRFEKPQEAVDQAVSWIEFCPRDVLPSLLGAAGSALRFLIRLDEAEHALYAAVRMAEELADQQTLGELLQRLAYVVFEKNEKERALSLAEMATMAHLRCANRIGVGRSLVDQGQWLRSLGRYQQAIAVQRMALEWLPEEEQHNRAAAFLELAQTRRALGQVEEAFKSLELAEVEAATLPRLEQHRTKWLRAMLCADQGDLNRASSLLEEVVDGLHSIHLGFMGLAVCDLVIVEIQRENLSAALQSRKKLLPLMEPLQQYKTASQAIVDLLEATQGTLTLALAQDIKSRIESELRNRILWQRLWVRTRL